MAAAAYLGVDHGLHGTQGIKGTEVEIHAVSKRPQDRQQLFGCGTFFAGNNPRLDHGVAFPVAALTLKVFFQRSEIHHQWTTLAIRTQAHIGAEHKAIYGRFIQRLNQLLAELDKVFLIGHYLRASGVAAVRVGKNKIDIRT